MQLFKKVSILMIAVMLLTTGWFTPGVIHAEDAATSATDASSSSQSSTASTVQSDTYGTDGNGGAGTTPTDPSTTTPPANPPVADPATTTTPTAKKSILTDAYLTDANGKVISNGDQSGAALDPDAPINLNYNWALPDDNSYTSGSTFEFDLPSAFKLYNDIHNVPLEFGDTTVGSFDATQSGHVTVTFNSTIDHYSDIRGTMQFHTAFSKETVTGSTEVKIPVPLGDSSQFIVVYLKPSKGADISKKGESIGSGKIRWTIDLNTTGEKLDNAVLSDPMGTGLALDPASIQVYKLNVNVDGSTSLGAQQNSGYTLTADQGQFKLSFDDSTRSAYCIIYVTSITDNAQTIFANTATLDSSKGSATAKAQVTVQQQFLSKKVDNYDRATGAIDWSIGYNLNNQSIPQSQALLKDRFDSSQQLVDGTLKVTDPSGNVLTEGTHYTITMIAPQNGRTGFNLQFKTDIQTAYTIKYRTAPTGQIIQNESINNTVIAGGVSVGVNQPVKGMTFTKVLSDANYIRKDATWKLTLNSAGQAIQGALIEDQFPNGGLELLPDTMQVTRSNGSVYPASQYKVTVTDVRAGFRIDFLQPPVEPLTITYRTTFDADWKKDKAEVSYHNVAGLYWLENGKYRTIPAEARFWPDNLTVNNGSKEGTYDPATKEVTWTIKANYNNKKLTNAILSDNIDPGQSYVPGSLGVYDMKLLGYWNGVQQGAAVDPSAYKVTTPDNGTSGGKLQIQFNNPIQSAYWITFKTTLSGTVIPPTVRNDAVLKGNEGDYPWAAVVSIPSGGEYVSKTGVQDNDRIRWTIQINAGQSYVENAKIVDTPTANQILLTDSFHLYEATSGSDGKLTKGNELVQGTDYKLSVMAGSPERYELSFTKPIQTAYILDYATLITANDRDTVSNSVQFSGNGITTGTVQTNKDIIVRSSSAAGTGSGAVGNLIVHKVDHDDTSLALAGAVFQLQDSAGLRPPVTLTTDAQGRALFTRLRYGTYNLQEITAPTGYVLDSTVHQVTINAANQQAGSVPFLTLENTKEPVVVPPTPGTPGTPETPPGTPGTPVDPGTPSNPGTPNNPGTPPSRPDRDRPSTTTPSGNTPPVETTTPDTPINDDPVPQGTVTPDQPSVPVEPETTPDIPIPDEPVPQGTTPPDETPDIPVPDEPVPRGTVPSTPTPPVQQPNVPMLPKTGEDSNTPFWIAGAGLVALGILLNQWNRRRVRSGGKSE